MRVVEHPAVRYAYVALTLSIVLAGDAWRFTFGWVVFGVVAIALGLWSVVVLVVLRHSWRPTSLPIPLLAFLLLATASLVWSHYPGATLLGLFTTWLIAVAGVAIALSSTWDEFMRCLSLVLRAILALSLLFELVVAVVIQRPILPLHTQPGVDYSVYETIPKMLYWSRNELFTVFSDGRIQGIVGNANNLGVLALIAVIVFGIQLADRKVGRVAGGAWLAVAIATLVFARSATVTVALVGVIALAGAAIVVYRSQPGRARGLAYAIIGSAAVAAVAASALFSGALLSILGKSDDLTGRLGIWEKVIALAQERPVVGWGWVSYWVPWADPFTDLAFRNGVRQLQAHNAWLDVWFQLGVLGAVVFATLVATALVRAWTRAVDPAIDSMGRRMPFRASSLLPLLVLGALVIQSVAESRLLVEFGLFLLVVFAVKTKLLDERRGT